MLTTLPAHRNVISHTVCAATRHSSSFAWSQQEWHGPSENTSAQPKGPSQALRSVVSVLFFDCFAQRTSRIRRRDWLALTVSESRKCAKCCLWRSHHFIQGAVRWHPVAAMGCCVHVRAWSRADPSAYRRAHLRAHELLAVPRHHVWQVELPGGRPDRTIAHVRSLMSSGPRPTRPKASEDQE